MVVMRKIWKYEIPAEAVFTTIETPCRSYPLAVASQHQPGVVSVWFEIDTLADPVERRFTVIPTGGTVPDGCVYRGTALALGGALVWHVYEATQ